MSTYLYTSTLQEKPGNEASMYVRLCVSHYVCFVMCVSCILLSVCRHWQQLSEELGVSVVPKPTLTFSKCLEMGLKEHIETITKVADIAGKEFSIEQVSARPPYR